MLQPENQPKKYQHLFTGIDEGSIRIPQFQRPFVWSKEQTAKLIDSIIKGFPIGTFILWKTVEPMRTVRSIGNADIPPPKDGETVHYVLDGQQRITSLFAVQKGLVYTVEGKEIHYRDICINLDVDPDADEEIVLTDPTDGATCISVHELLNGTVMQLAKTYSFEQHLERIDTYRSRLMGYDFSTIVMSAYPIDIACEVFTRINTGGTSLSLFEIMVAKTYNLEPEFDLSHEYEWFIDNNGAPAEKDLEDADFDTVPPSIVLQCIAAHLKGMVRRKDILKLEKHAFIDAWPTVKGGIFSAVDYIRTHLRIPVSHLLPYYAVLVPYCYFFIRNGGDHPTPQQHAWLCQYFWWASLSSRYSSGAEGKLALDLKKMDAILDGKSPDYQGEEFTLNAEDIQWRWFSATDAVCKAVLCLLAYHEPKSFASNSLVKIDNSWLKRADSKNYHHFFPKSFLHKQGIEYWQANTIVNITIVDDYLNKRKIGGRAPSKYMAEFAADNIHLSETVKTHLIDDLVAFGVNADDYETFIEQRTKKILAELNARLHPVA